MTKKIIDSILKKTGIPNLLDILINNISFSELQSLLMEVYNRKISKLNQTELLNNYINNRFVQPSIVSPKDFTKLDLKLFSIIPIDFELIELSPLAPLGSSSLITPVNQNNIVSTIRNTEVMADSTNILSLESAKRRQVLLKNNSKSTEKVKLCTRQRLVRGQPTENINFTPHFSIFALCTAGRDEGNNKFEEENLIEHIKFYLTLIQKTIEIKEINKITIKLYNLDGEILNVLATRGVGYFHREVEVPTPDCITQDNACVRVELQAVG